MIPYLAQSVTLNAVILRLNPIFQNGLNTLPKIFFLNWENMQFDLNYISRFFFFKFAVVKFFFLHS